MAMGWRTVFVCAGLGVAAGLLALLIGVSDSRKEPKQPAGSFAVRPTTWKRPKFDGRFAYLFGDEAVKAQAVVGRYLANFARIQRSGRCGSIGKPEC